jgi:putative membrane protein
MWKSASWTAAVGLAVLSASCTKPNDESPPNEPSALPRPGATPVRPPPGGPSAPASGITDGDIGQIVMNANAGEIDASRFIADKTTNEDVKSFANMMIDDHEQATKDMKDTLDKIGVKTRDSAASDGLRAVAKIELEHLKAAQKDDLDRTYMKAMIEDHQGVLASLDDKLIPAAQAPELKDFLAKVRVKVAAHLDQAKKIGAGIGI